MNDYIIAVDRDGQPYIAHAWGQRGANGQHKYIAKIGEGAKARYFYTQEQLRAFQQGARQGAQNAANKAKEKASDAVGRVRENSVLLNVGNQYRAARGAYQNSKSSDPQIAKWGKEGYERNNTLGGKAYKAQQKVKDSVKDSLRKNVSGYREREIAVDKKKQANIAERERFDSASKFSKALDNALKSEKDYRNNPNRENHQKFTEAKNRANSLADEYYGTKNSEGKLTKAERTSNDAIDAMSKYRDTPLYKLEEFSKHPVDKITNAIGDTITDAVWSIDDKVKSVKEKKQQRKNVKNELRMQSDPLVSKARSEYRDAQTAYNKANNQFMNYMLSSDAKKDSDKWKRLEMDYKYASADLESALEKLEKAERKYK